MPVDVSSYRTQPQGPNLLEQLTQLRGAAESLGDIEVGKGMQQAIQPDGSVDRNVLAQHLKGTVAGSMKATPALTALEHLRSAGYSTDRAGIESLMAKNGFIASILGPYAAKDSVSRSELMDGAGKLVKEAHKYGIKIPEILDGIANLNKVPEGAPLAKALKERVLQGQQAETVLKSILDQTPAIDTGGTIERPNVGSPFAPKTGSIEKTLPPGTEVANPDQSKRLIGPGGDGTRGRVDLQRPSAAPGSPPPVRQAMEGATVVSRGPTTDPRTGQVIADSSFDAIRQRGQRPAAAGGAAPGAPPPAAAAPSPVAPAAPPAPPAAPPVAAAPPMTFDQRFRTAFPPGSSAPLEAAAGAYNERIKEAGTFAERINPLKSADELLAKMPKGSTGPGTEGINKFRAALEVMGIKPPGEATMKDFVKLHKYLEQNIAATAPAGTNVPGVMQTIASNPNTSQPKEALQDLIRVGMALTRMKQAGILEFQAAVDARQADPQDFNKFMAKWATKQDPRAYIVDRLGKEGRTKLDKDVNTAAERKKFKESYLSAKRAGVIDLE